MFSRNNEKLGDWSNDLLKFGFSYRLMRQVNDGHTILELTSELTYLYIYGRPYLSYGWKG
jgi:hypothetical protein